MMALFLALCLNVNLAYPTETEVDAVKELTAKQTEATLNKEWMQSEEGVVTTEKTAEDEILGKSRIIKRQVIKIPSGVTKVKVIAPNPVPQIRPKRMPPMNRIHGYGNSQRKRPPRRHNHKRPSHDPEDDYEESIHHKHREEGRREKKHKPKVVVKDVSREEFYSDIDDFQHLPTSNSDSYETPVRATRRRKQKKHVHYGSFDDMNEQPRRIRKPAAEKEQDWHGDQEYFRPVKHHYDGRPGSSYGSEHNYNREYDIAASSIHMKQVPAPNLTGLNLIDPPDMMKEAKTTSFKAEKDTSADPAAKKSPTPREIQGAFPPLYTSHNPHVMTNFGLDDGKIKGKSYNSPVSTVKFSQQTSASEQHVTSVPAGGNGLQVVQPPQLGTGQTSAASVPVLTATTIPNQRATIRDILQQDCPDYEMLGYCSSPPRYPTIQIANMAMKCPELLDVMASPVPPEPQDDLTSFSRRSDDDIDIMFDEENGTRSSDDYGLSRQSWPSWSRSGSDSETACSSEYTIIEPGYAREVTSGRWFVIVQNSDSSLQKVTTDTCSSPGKPCSGLAGMKCSRNRGYHNGIKSTRCIQRYTHQRLISWDPEAPQKCPKIRIFRFPTACVCHLRLM